MGSTQNLECSYQAVLWTEVTRVLKGKAFRSCQELVQVIGTSLLFTVCSPALAKLSSTDYMHQLSFISLC